MGFDGYLSRLRLGFGISAGLREIAGRLDMPELGGGSVFGVSELPAQSGTPLWVGIGVLRCFACAQW